jgi:hypothetical protein
MGSSRSRHGQQQVERQQQQQEHKWTAAGGSSVRPMLSGLNHQSTGMFIDAKYHHMQANLLLDWPS